MQASSSQTILSIIDKLIEKTQSGKISWTPATDSSLISKCNGEIKFFLTPVRLSGRVFLTKIGIFSFRIYKYEDISLTGTVLTDYKKVLSPISDRGNYRYALEIYDENSQDTEYSFPYTNAISDLYEIIKSQYINLDVVLQELEK